MSMGLEFSGDLATLGRVGCVQQACAHGVYLLGFERALSVRFSMCYIVES